MMSIELLPPDKIYPTGYSVDYNQCKCHSETCCCNDWAVYNNVGEKQRTFYFKEDAELFSNILNSPTQPSKNQQLIK